MPRSRHGIRALLALSPALLLPACAPEEPVREEAPPGETVAGPAPAAPVDLLPNGIRVTDGLLVGGQPSADQLQALRDAGYRTVVNLRTDSEETEGAEQVEVLGMRYVSLPVAGAEGLTEENAQALAEILAAEETGRAVLHCGSGNRVGALLALKAYHVDGATPEEALAFGLEAGMTRLEPAVRERLSLEAP